MAKNKKRNSVNNSEFYKELKRIEKIINSIEQQGFIFDRSSVPNVGNKITNQKIKKLKQIDYDYILKNSNQKTPLINKSVEHNKQILSNQKITLPKSKNKNHKTKIHNKHTKQTENKKQKSNKKQTENIPVSEPSSQKNKENSFPIGEPATQDVIFDEIDEITKRLNELSNNGDKKFYDGEINFKNVSSELLNIWVNTIREYEEKNAIPALREYVRQNMQRIAELTERVLSYKSVTGILNCVAEISILLNGGVIPDMRTAEKISNLGDYDTYDPIDDNLMYD